MKAWIMALFGVVASTATAAQPPAAAAPGPSRPVPHEPLATPMPPPPPIFVSPPPTPPAFYADRDGTLEAQRARRAEIVATQQRLMTFDIEMRGAKVPLWSGSLRLRGNGNSASYTQSKQDAADSCLGENGSARQTNDLRLTINRVYSNEGEDRFSVAANWARPQDNCPDGVGIQTVSFQLIVAVKPGETRELRGDGGLVVTLTRRR